MLTSVRKATFAKMCRVSRPQVDRMKDQGKIVLDENGYVPLKNKINKLYMAKHGVQLPGQAKSKKGGELPLPLQRIEWQIRVDKEREKMAILQRARLLGQLIDRRLLDAMFAAFIVEIKNQLLTMAKGIADEVNTIAVNGEGSRAVEEKIGKEAEERIQRAISKAKSVGLPVPGE